MSGYKPQIGDRVQWRDNDDHWLPFAEECHQTCVVGFDDHHVFTLDTDDGLKISTSRAKVRLDERPEPDGGWDVNVTLPEPPLPYRFEVANNSNLRLDLNGEYCARWVYRGHDVDWVSKVVDALAPPEPPIELAEGQVWRCEVGGPTWTIVEVTDQHVIYDLGGVRHMPRRVMTLDGFHAVKGELVEGDDDE